MKIDYNKIMQKEISSFGFKPKLLLHCCCAPCSSAVIERIKECFDITFYYYNPNIYPLEEYVLRFKEFEKLGVNVVLADYAHEDFLSMVCVNSVYHALSLKVHFMCSLIFLFLE